MIEWLIVFTFAFTTNMIIKSVRKLFKLEEKTLKARNSVKQLNSLIKTKHNDPDKVMDITNKLIFANWRMIGNSFRNVIVTFGTIILMFLAFLYVFGNIRLPIFGYSIRWFWAYLLFSFLIGKVKVKYKQSVAKNN